MRNEHFLFNTIVLLIFSLSACNINKEYTQPELIAEKFASYYFNYDFNKAFSLCTEESKQWITFHVSKISQDELDYKNQHKITSTAKVVESIYYNDSLVKTTVILNKVIKKSLYNDSVFCESGRTEVTLVKRGENWLIKMEAPLQSEK